MRLKVYIIIGLFIFAWSGYGQTKGEAKLTGQQLDKESKDGIEKIKVLNFGTFHMGFSTDLNQTEFDQHDKENKKAVHRIAEKLAAFKPTVILVEIEPKNNGRLQREYESYLLSPNRFIKNPSEVELLAFEVGRLSGANQIYGIDHRMGYNYLIARDLDNVIDSDFIVEFYSSPEKYYPKVNIDEDKLNLFDRLKLTNENEYLDFLMTMNADIMTHAGTEGNFEGADEAAKYYQRNLRMYSNLNRIKLKQNDRVFVLLGASHTAFFRDFLSRSPKYEMVNTFDYLK